jgi:hypothetical protein
LSASGYVRAWLGRKRWRLRIGDCYLDEGKTITIDAARGHIYPGELELLEERPNDLIDRVRARQQARQV